MNFVILIIMYEYVIYTKLMITVYNSLFIKNRHVVRAWSLVLWSIVTLTKLKNNWKPLSHVRNCSQRLIIVCSLRMIVESAKTLIKSLISKNLLSLWSPSNASTSTRCRVINYICFRDSSKSCFKIFSWDSSKSCFKTLVQTFQSTYLFLSTCVNQY